MRAKAGWSAPAQRLTHLAERAIRTEREDQEAAAFGIPVDSHVDVAQTGFDLTLDHVLDAARIPADEVLVIRHTCKEDGLRNAGALTADVVRTYTRGQLVKPSKFPQSPPRLWRHGGNVALREALGENPHAAHNYTFSCSASSAPGLRRPRSTGQKHTTIGLC